MTLLYLRQDTSTSGNCMHWVPPAFERSAQAGSFRASLQECEKSAEKQEEEHLPRDARSLRVKGTRSRKPAQSALLRAWSWLHGKYVNAPSKRLRVAEVVSFGEKRFVALVTVEGREFLIGGGASGVSLMTPLESKLEPLHALRSDLRVKEESD
jgi:hypothetical protein